MKYLFIYLTFYLSIILSISLFLFLFSPSSIEKHLFIYLSFYSSIYFIHLSILFFVFVVFSEQQHHEANISRPARESIKPSLAAAISVEVISSRNLRRTTITGEAEAIRVRIIPSQTINSRGASYFELQEGVHGSDYTPEGSQNSVRLFC